MVTNTPILTDCISLVGGMIGALLMSGVFALRRRYRHRDIASVTPIQDVIDPGVLNRIDEAAAQWSRNHELPEAQVVVARKLRLAYRLANRTHSQRWSR